MTDDLAEALRAGDRRALARAITLVESRRADHREQARVLVDALLPHTGRAMRVGISGAPGSGKSTLIEAIGLQAVDAGRQVAVLAVDPSSARGGGSILGDKTRMTELGRRPEAYIRPTPTGGALGGIARRTREALLLCEAAGFDVILVETVGVGQSEVAVADVVDLFILVASPAGGDELQGMKRGIMELADLIVVNKADGDLLPGARRSAGELQKAIRLLRPKRPGWEVEVALASALTGTGIPEVWTRITGAMSELERSGALPQLRSEQAVAAMWTEIRSELVSDFEADDGVTAVLSKTEAEVRSGLLAPASAAQRLLSLHRPGRS